MTRILTSQGFSRGVFAVLYDRDGKSAVRVWWLLQYFGHAMVSVLQGGMARWKEQGRPMEFKTKVTLPRTAETAFSAQIQPQMIMEEDELTEILNIQENINGEQDIRLIQSRANAGLEQVVTDAVRICERAVDQKKVLAILEAGPQEIADAKRNTQIIDARAISRKNIEGLTRISYQTFYENG